MEPATWDKHIELYLDEKHAKRSKINKENRAKNKNTSRHGSRLLAESRYEYVSHIMIILHIAHYMYGV